MADDGKGADKAAGDGIDTGIVAPPTVGRYWLAVHATGKSVAGSPFERHAGTSFVASEPTVQIRSVGPPAWILGGRSRPIGQLSVPVGFAGPAGSYEVVVTLRAVNGRSAKGNALIEARGKELMQVTVALDQNQISSLGADGPYNLQSTEVFELTAEDRILRARRVGMEKTPPLKLGSLVIPKP